MRNLDWTVIRTAATGGLLLIVPGALLANYLFDGAASAWVWLFLLVVIGGFALAGYIAGRLRPDTPMIHGGIGAVLAFVVALVFGAVVVARRGDSLSPAAIVVTALLAASFGVGGALVSDWVHRRHRRRSVSGIDPA